MRLPDEAEHREEREQADEAWTSLSLEAPWDGEDQLKQTQGPREAVRCEFVITVYAALKSQWPSELGKYSLVLFNAANLHH